MLADELVDKVCDRESFLAYATALAEERIQAENIEIAEPETYKWGAALGWQNTSVSAFIAAGLTHFDEDFDGKVIETPTWRDLAYFLFCGKHIE